MQKIRFSSAQELVNWLMENEGQILSDSYGRKMYYENFKFYFMDISSNGHFIDGIYCLHLFGETWSYEE